MRLVKFQESKKRDVYINPDKVVAVRKHNDNLTMIFVLQGVYSVMHPIEEVIQKLEDNQF